ncbi:MAG: acyltransferase [Hyphomicrobiales bacterium]|nr:MAG: acyltransferase [Hyphomicrobiales bacterium]
MSLHNKTHPTNNFDFRIVAASMVLFSHHFALTGQGEPSFFGLYSLGGLAVAIFFIISGYLVTISWYRDPHLLRFAYRRILRIWPALIFVVLLVAFVLGPMASALTVRDYFLHGATWDYLRILVMQIHYVLPGVFEHNPYAQGVNGSLWTIPLEVRCYIVLGIAGLIGLLKYRPIFLLAIFFYLSWFLLTSNADKTGVVHQGRMLSAFFLLGGAMAVLEPAWRRHPLTWFSIIFVSFTALWIMGGRHTATLLGLPFLIIYAGTRCTPVIHRAGRFGDPSYGIYLFAFPFQQAVIAYFWPEAGFWQTLALATSCTVALAYASWHLLEKQVLKLKPSSKSNRLKLHLTAPIHRAKGIALSAADVIKDKLSHILNATWITFILVAATQKVIAAFPAPDSAVEGDAFWTYLPNARGLIENPLNFLTTNSASIHVAPLGYIWPALWNANPAATQLANSILFILSVVLLWRFAARVAGFLAGAVTSALIVFHPEMSSFAPQVMTESLYLFGFSLFLLAAAEYVFGKFSNRGWLVAASLGLTITLLSRPVLQLLTVAGLFIACAGTFAVDRMRATKYKDAHPILNKNLCVALAVALVLPLAVAIKNGVYFQYWGISTGSGSGLYYGVSPFKMGIEPIYTGFSYDADIIPRTVDPSTQGHPLIPKSNSIMTEVAKSIITNTSAADNFHFFVFKAKAWLFFTSEELSIQPKLRLVRTFEWLSITLAALLIFGRFLRSRFGLGKKQERRETVDSHEYNENLKRLGFCGFLLILLAGMTAQFLPVLYNMRYNLYFMEPLLMPLCGISIAFIIKYCSTFGGRPGNQVGMTHALRHSLKGIGVGVAVVLILAYLANTLTQHAKRHKAWAMDPMRPGPTEIALDSSEFGKPIGKNLENFREESWTVVKNPASLHVSFKLSDSQSIANMRDAIWRLKLAIETPYNDRKCKNVEIAISTPSSSAAWYMPKPIVNVQTDAHMHIYALHGNGKLRPSASGELILTLNCPAGTSLTWGGAQLLKVAMPEAAYALISTGTPINPYRADDISVGRAIR